MQCLVVGKPEHSHLGRDIMPIESVDMSFQGSEADAHVNVSPMIVTNACDNAS